MERLSCWLQLRLCWCYNKYVGVTTTLRMRTMSQHIYYVLLTYLCTSCVLFQWLCCHNLYYVVNILSNTLSGLNGAMWGSDQYFYAIATVSSVLCCCCCVFLAIVSNNTSQPAPSSSFWFSPHPNIFLSRFASILFFVIVPTGKLLVNLGGGSDYRLW